MNALSLPRGAGEIVELRLSGKRPAEMILVSLIGPLREINPVVIAQAESHYDWRFLAGLEVMLVVDTKIAPEAITRVLAAMKSVSPASLSIWFADQQDGANLIAEGSALKTAAARRMGSAERVANAGLGSAIPAIECIARMAKQAKREAVENSGRFDSALVALAQQGFEQIFGVSWGAA